MTRRALPALVMAWALTAGPIAAQPARIDPHIGFVYPAGGRQGTVVQLSIGGQFLRDVSGVRISGEGVHATVLRHIPPLAGNIKEILAELKRLVQVASKADGAGLGGTEPALIPSVPAEPVMTEPVMAGPVMAGPMPSASPSPVTAAMPGDGALDRKEARREQVLQHPLILELRQLNAKELQYVLKDIRDGRKRQPNPQIAETVVVQLSIDREAAAGERELRIITRNGLSNPVAIQVGQLPEIREHEPNNPDWPQIQAVTPPVVLNGWLSPGDVDCFRFPAKKGQRLVFDASARRLMPYLADAVPGWFQAALCLRDSRGREIAFSDGCGFDPDPLLMVEIPADGEYRLEVRDALYRGRMDFVYRVSIQERGSAVAARPGAGGDWPADPRAPWDELSYEAMRGAGSAPTEPGNQTERLPERPEVEPNGDAASAPAVEPPVVVTGGIGSPGDVDVHRFRARAGQSMIFDVKARRLRSPLDSLVRVSDASGRVLAWNDDRKGVDTGLLTQQADSYLSWTVPADGEYFVSVSDAQGHGGAAYRYRLRVSPPRPDYMVFVTPSGVDLPPGPAVPLTLHVVRSEGFAGDVEVELESAPAGYTLAGARVPGGLAELRATLSLPPGPVDPPVELKLKARAQIGTEWVERPVIPCEEMTQAFLIHHLVAVEALLVGGRGPRPMTRFVRLDQKGPLRIPSGGVAEALIQVPRAPLLKDARFELAGAPRGVTLESVGTVPHFLSQSLSLRVKADAHGPAPGYRDNLIVEILLDKEANDAKSKGNGQKRRVSVGFMPAIPFEITAPALTGSGPAR